MSSTLTSARTQAWRGHLTLAGQTLIISMGYVLGRETAQRFDPLLLTGMRAALSGLVYLILWRLEGKGPAFGGLPLLYRRRLLLLSVLGIFFNQLLFNWGLRYTTAAKTAIIYALTPSIVFLLGLWLFHREKLLWQKVVPLLLAYGGVVLALWHNFLHGGHGWGAGLLVAAVFCWGLYLNFSPPIIERLGAWRVTAYVMIIGAVLHSPALVVGAFRQEWAALTPKAWLGLAYLVLGMSVAAYLLLNYGLRYLTPTQAALYINLQPLCTLLIAALMGQEPFTWQLGIAALLTTGGMILFRR